MELKTVGILLALSLLAIGGVVYAFPQMGFMGMTPWNQNNTTNSTGHWGNRNMTGMMNGTMHWRNNSNMSNTNWTQIQSEMTQFNQAVSSGDYQTALTLHQTYGFGGPIFDKLNQTTFGEYSQIYNTRQQLSSETSQLYSSLGMNMSNGMGQGMRGPPSGRFHGHRGGNSPMYQPQMNQTSG